MDTFGQIAAMPALRRLFDLAWRCFGVNPALVSPDGQRVAIFEVEKRQQPFCAALQIDPVGRSLCAMCDQNRFLEARRRPMSLSYCCHAGLHEFIVPVIGQGEVLAWIQCGQVHEHQPTAAEWRTARQSLTRAGLHNRELRLLFAHNRVLSPQRQADLLSVLELIAHRLAYAAEYGPEAEPGQVRLEFGRALTFIEAHLAERLSLAVIARAAGLSTRSLERLFHKQVGVSVVDFILRRRIARARDLLQHTELTSAEIAFRVGFGSVQHFNRIFRRHEKMAPRRWRQQSLARQNPHASVIPDPESP